MRTFQTHWRRVALLRASAPSPCGPRWYVAGICQWCPLESQIPAGWLTGRDDEHVTG